MRTLTVAAVAAVLACTGCRASVELGGDDDGGATTHTLEVRGSHTAFDLEVPVAWAITDVWDADTCGSVSYVVAEEGRRRLVVEAVPSACAEAGRDEQIGNGFHGTYRTVEDIPDPQEPATVPTALGEATVVTQEYFECTNSCERWDEPIAVVTVREPVDAAYPTLVVRGEKDSVTRAELEEVVATLAAPYVPTG